MRISDDLVIDWVETEPPTLVVADQHNGNEHIVALTDIPDLARKIAEHHRNGHFPLWLPEDAPVEAQVGIRAGDYPGASFALGLFWGDAARTGRVARV